LGTARMGSTQFGNFHVGCAPKLSSLGTTD
jgi:hypothetical protein